MDTVYGFLEEFAFAGFMLGWVLMLAGGALHMVGGGFRDGASKVPVLGNWENLQPGEDGFLLQAIAGWMLKMGLLLIVVGGVLYFG